MLRLVQIARNVCFSKIKKNDENVDKVDFWDIVCRPTCPNLDSMSTLSAFFAFCIFGEKKTLLAACTELFSTPNSKFDKMRKNEKTRNFEKKEQPNETTGDEFH